MQLCLFLQVKVTFVLAMVKQRLCRVKRDDVDHRVKRDDVDHAARQHQSYRRH